MTDFIMTYTNFPSDLEVWQVALVLNISQATVRSMIRKGKLYAYRLGRGYIVPKHVLRDYILSSAQQGGVEGQC